MSAHPENQPLKQSQHFQKFISLIPNNLTSPPRIDPGTSKVSYNCNTPRGRPRPPPQPQATSPAQPARQKLPNIPNLAEPQSNQYLTTQSRSRPQQGHRDPWARHRVRLPSRGPRRDLRVLPAQQTMNPARPHPPPASRQPPTQPKTSKIELPNRPNLAESV